MLTPQQIQDKKFEKALFNGYDMGQIDEFLDELLNDYTSLYKENATLKTKMKVLVDKIEEYRAVDEEMRKTLYTAQRTAKEITERARAEAEAMVGNARAAAESSMTGLRGQIEEEHRRLEEAKRANADYVEKIRQIMQRNIDALGEIVERPAAPTRAAEPPRSALGDAFSITLPEDVIEQTQSLPIKPPAVEEEISFDQRREAESPARSNLREVREPVRTGGGEMETRFFEIELGGHAEQEPEPDTDTGKLYGSDLFTPKPRYEQKDIRFGKDYNMDEE